MKTNQQSGFTLIELVMVIVILGILAAVAVPSFIDVRRDSAQAAVSGVAASLAGASNMNRAARLIGTNFATVTNCTGFGTMIEGGALPSGYTLASQAISVTAGGMVTQTCTVTGGLTGATASATFIGHGISS